MPSVRRKPYTERGLERLSCVRCGDQATEQWLVRSCRVGVDFGYLPVCDDCDEMLNDVVISLFL